VAILKQVIILQFLDYTHGHMKVRQNVSIVFVKSFLNVMRKKCVIRINAVILDERLRESAMV